MRYISHRDCSCSSESEIQGAVMCLLSVFKIYECI